jgi:hypothetical protein
MSGGAASMAASSPERGCRCQPTGVETACGCGAAKLRSNRLSAAGDSGQSAGAAGSEGCLRRAGGAAGCESIRGSAEVGQQICGLRSVAEDVYSLARLEQTDAASESRTSLLVMPSRKEEKAEGLN